MMMNNYNPNPNYYNYQNDLYSKPQMKQYAFVNGIDAANNFQIGTNQSMLLMDENHPLCYMKTTDAIGRSSLRYFKLEEIDEQSALGMLQPSSVADDKFASKEDIVNINKRLDDILKKLEKNSNKKDGSNNG